MYLRAARYQPTDAEGTAEWWERVAAERGSAGEARGWEGKGVLSGRKGEGEAAGQGGRLPVCTVGGRTRELQPPTG